MKVSLLIAAVLAILIPMAASATTLGWQMATTGGTTTYTYTLNSSESGDSIISLHVYAPISPLFVTSGSADRGWAFTVGTDSETGCADIYWAAPDPLTQGLPDHGTMSMWMNVPSWTTPVFDYALPDCLGNWGYETLLYQDWGVLVSFPSVAVPAGVTAPAVPEPATVAGMVMGVGLLCGTWRRRAAKP